MDGSKVRAYVTKYIEPLMEAIGVPHWRVTVSYLPLEGDAAANVSLEHAPYMRASIIIDPFKCESEKDIRLVLVHELLHIIIEPFVLYRNFMYPLLRDNKDEQTREAIIYTHAMERTIYNLEIALAKGLRHKNLKLKEN